MSRTLTALALTLTGIATLACGASAVPGERAALGACPRGEVCSDKAPEGLIFTGMSLWDEPGDRLGPVLLGGKFELGFLNPAGDFGAWQVEVDGPAIAAWADDEHAVLGGMEVGSAVVRIVDEQGALFDRLPMDVVEIDHIELGLVNDPDRTTLLGGCTDMVGIRLIATGRDGGSFRAFDADIRFSASQGSVQPDPFVWDCFQVDVPADATSITFSVTAGGETWEHSLDVVVVDDPANCPATVD